MQKREEKRKRLQYASLFPALAAKDEVNLDVPLPKEAGGSIEESNSEKKDLKED